MLNLKLAAGLAMLMAAAPIAGLAFPLPAATPATATMPATPAAPDAGATAPATTASVLDGVFTEAQAERGRAGYRENCLSCHGGNLRGTPTGPSLLGGRFDSRWENLTLADMYTFIHDSMPAGRGGSLDDQMYIDIVAYILSRAGYPAGETELAADLEALALIQIVEAP